MFLEHESLGSNPRFTVNLVTLKWRIRLSVRTQDFHSWKRDSTSLCATLLRRSDKPKMSLNQRLVWMWPKSIHGGYNCDVSIKPLKARLIQKG